MPHAVPTYDRFWLSTAPHQPDILRAALALHADGVIPPGAGHGAGASVFIRGDSNGDGDLSVADPISTLNYLFTADHAMGCADASDFNDDGRVDISDPIYGLTYLFIGGPAPRAPFPNFGEDPTDDELTCF